MNATLVHIPGTYGKAIAEHIQRVWSADIERTKSIMDGILLAFFEVSVNTRWARFNTPGVFWRKKLGRSESDSLFTKLYFCEGACDSWPMWAIKHLDAYECQIRQRKNRDAIFDDAMIMFRSGCDVYLSQDRFSGILRIDEFFDKLQPLSS